MFSNFKALLVAGVALPALVGVAFAQGVTTSNTVSPSAPSVKSDTAISTPSVKSDAKVTPSAKADAKVDQSAKSSTKVEPSANSGTSVDTVKPAPGKTSEIVPKSDAPKMSAVKQHHQKKQHVQTTGAADGAAANQIARGPAKPPKAGDVATPGTAAQKL
jgi:hypothetical protein